MRHSKSTILLLEDDRLFAETLADFLEEEGYAVEIVHDPYTAMDRGFASHYDLYLFDVNLPFESGFDLLKKLRDGDDRIRVSATPQRAVRQQQPPPRRQTRRRDAAPRCRRRPRRTWSTAWVRC